MKRYIYILIASTFLVSTVKAQLSYGVKAGGGLTGLPGRLSSSSLGNYYGGVLGSIPLHKAFSLQAELNYSAQGGKQWLYFETWDPVTGYTSGYPAKVSYRMNYLNLPVLLNYKTSSGFFVEGGLQAGLLLNAHAKHQGKFDVKDSYKSFDLSSELGAGYQLPSGLGVNLRYNYGLTNVIKREDYRTYNSVLQMGLFYVLNK